MPTKTKMKYAAIAATSAALAWIPKELIDQFVNGQMSGEAVTAVPTASIGADRARAERRLGPKLGHFSGADTPEAPSNRRNHYAD